MGSLFREQLEQWLGEQQVRAKRVLDIGGSQFPIKGRTEIWEVEEYAILDLPNPHEGHPPDIAADINLPLVENLPREHDVVFCLEVMEYVWNPVLALQNVRSFLKPGGTLFISFPFVYPVHNPQGADFLRYTPDGAEKLLKETGFEVVSHDHRNAETSLISAYDDCRMKGRRGFDHTITGSLIIAKAL